MVSCRASMASTLAPCPVWGPSTSNPSSRLIHSCLALKLAFLPLSSRSFALTNPYFSVTSTSSSTLSDDCIVGPFCPRFSSLPSISFFRGDSWSSDRLHLSSKHAPPRLSLVSSSGIRPVVLARCHNGAPILMDKQARIGQVTRTTKETDVKVSINIDGTGICETDTGIPFLDHMLDQLASHGLFDLNIRAKGDLHIDDHHTNEDVALALGTALLQALGDRKGISRFGDFTAPLDEALVHVVLDLSGRPFLAYDMDIPTQRVGTYDTQLVEHFFQSLVNTSGMTLHIRKLSGKNSHHIIEASFKAFARALRKATEFDERRKGRIPSSKGLLSRA